MVGSRGGVACGDDDVVLPVFSPLPEIPDRETVGSGNNVGEGSVPLALMSIVYW